MAPKGKPTERRPTVVEGRPFMVDDVARLARLSPSSTWAEVVELASSAEQAIELLSHDDRFDMVLCDIMMPDVTGIELFEQIVQTHPHLRDRFVFMTGGTPTGDTLDFIERVGRPCLEKPFEMQKLTKLLRSVKASTIQ